LPRVIIVVDQLTKQWVLRIFRLHEMRPVTGFFNLVLVYNSGAAFSFLAGAGGWQKWFFVAWHWAFRSGWCACCASTPANGCCRLPCR
jgi:signal peptidase II